MADVDVPGAGKTPKKAVVVIGGIAGVYVAWRWYAARKASAAAGAAPTPVDTSNTGAAQGSVSGYTNPGGIPQTSTTSSAPADNAAWTAKVVSDLSGIGYDGQAVALAVGQYLAGQPLTPDQQAIIRVAWGYDGKPPQSTNLSIIPAQGPPTPTPTPTPEPTPVPEPTAAPVPTDPHAGMHLQPPQVATLEHGRSLVMYAKSVYPTDTQVHLQTLIALNPTLGPNDTTHPTMLIRTSDARWVPN